MSKLSIVLKFVFLPLLALALGLSATALLLSQVQAVQASPQAWDAASFDLGEYHACAVTSGGGVKCWGENFYGQLGDGTIVVSSTPVNVSGLSSGIVAVSAGAYFSCARTSSGEVRCWGDNYDGELGNNTVTADCTGAGYGDICSSTPVPVLASGGSHLSGVLAVSSGAYHTCALMPGGTVQCWGGNWAGQLGDGTTTDSITPLTVLVSPGGSSLSGVLAISAGGEHTCALMSGGGVKCWGFNGYGQLGDGTNTNSSSPVDVTDLTGVSNISAGDRHTCAVISGGGVKCWGYNGSGQLGNNTTDDQSSPVAVLEGSTPTPLSGIISVSGGYYHTCAATSTGGVKCWGDNTSYQLGDGSAAEIRMTAVPVVGLGGIAAAVASGTYDSCARLTGGAIECWGDNLRGELGNGIPSYRWSPVPVLGASSGVSDISVGSDFTCAVIYGAAKCWGGNENGQLGIDPSVIDSPPVTVTGLTSGISSVADGDAHACAVTSFGGMICWGENWRGELGDGNADLKYSPPVVVTDTATHSPLSGITQAGAGTMFSCARTTAGGVKCWGGNLRGEVGNGTFGNEFHTPQDVLDAGSGLPLSGVSAISVGEYHACALLTNGTVKCWGNSIYGRLGNTTEGNGCDYYGTTCSSSALTVTATPGGSPLSGVIAIGAGAEHTCAVLSNGQVKCWGANDDGQLGNTSGTSICPGAYGDTSLCSFAPLTVTVTAGGLPLTGMVSVSAGADHSCALAAGGGVLCWGGNYLGQLGDNTRTNRPSPVAVSGLTNAAAISAKAYHTCARSTTGAAVCWGDNPSGELGNGEVAYSRTPVQVLGFIEYNWFLPVILVRQ